MGNIGQQSIQPRVERLEEAGLGREDQRYGQQLLTSIRVARKQFDGVFFSAQHALTVRPQGVTFAVVIEAVMVRHGNAARSKTAFCLAVTIR